VRAAPPPLGRGADRPTHACRAQAPGSASQRGNVSFKHGVRTTGPAELVAGAGLRQIDAHKRGRAGAMAAAAAASPMRRGHRGGGGGGGSGRRRRRQPVRLLAELATQRVELRLLQRVALPIAPAASATAATAGAQRTHPIHPIHPTKTNAPPNSSTRPPATRPPSTKSENIAAGQHRGSPLSALDVLRLLNIEAKTSTRALACARTRAVAAAVVAAAPPCVRTARRVY
jgi:hypothetical protein